MPVSQAKPWDTARSAGISHQHEAIPKLSHVTGICPRHETIPKSYVTPASLHISGHLVGCRICVSVPADLVRRAVSLVSDGASTSLRPPIGLWWF